MSEDVVHKSVSFQYEPRPYQKAFLRAMANGCKRAVIVWPRRAGKDTTALNFLVVKALQRVGSYYYFFPTFNQGRRIIWDGMNRNGQRFLHYIPQEVIESTNETEMQVKLKNGSIIQIVGTDRIDNIVGTNPVGCLFSEYPIQNPRGWEFVRPILTENGGWAVFIYTPRSRNHGYDLYREAMKLQQKNGSWFCQLLTVEDVINHDGTRVITDDDIQAEREAGMPEEIIQQEFYCSFEGANVGSYWGSIIAQLRKAGRIGHVPYNPSVPVVTSWDLGYGDANAIWFAQIPNSSEVNIIDFEVGSGKSLTDWAKIVLAKPYAYGMHIFPHDMKQGKYDLGQSRYEIASQLGLNPYRVLRNKSIKDGIDAGRRLLPRCNFDSEKCDERRFPLGGSMRTGIDALVEYQKEYDEINKCFKDNPLHNWASNPADSFRYLSIGLRDYGGQIQQYAESSFNPFTYQADQRRALTYESAFEVFE